VIKTCHGRGPYSPINFGGTWLILDFTFWSAVEQNFCWCAALRPVVESVSLQERSINTETNVTEKLCNGERATPNKLILMQSLPSKVIPNKVEATKSTSKQLSLFKKGSGNKIYKQTDCCGVRVYTAQVQTPHANNCLRGWLYVVKLRTGTCTVLCHWRQWQHERSRCLLSLIRLNALASVDLTPANQTPMLVHTSRQGNLLAHLHPHKHTPLCVSIIT